MKATSSTPRVRILAAGLREIREGSGVGLRQLARTLGFAPQMLSLWENGLRLPSVTEVALILGYFEVRGERQQHLLELARTVREPHWVGDRAQVVRCEQEASLLTAWESGTVPALLQTPDYARAIFESSRLTADEVDSRIVALLERRRVLTRRDPVAFRAVLDARVLTDVVGNEDVMSDQMDHLVALSRLPNVAIRVLDGSGGYHPGRSGSFTLAEYATAAPMVLLEQHRFGVFLSEPGQVAAFRELARRLADAAMNEEESRERIRAASRQEDAMARA